MNSDAPDERHDDENWCEPDGCPAAICGGPHVVLKYDDKELIVPMRDVGELASFIPDPPMSLSKGLRQDMSALPIKIDYDKLRAHLDNMSPEEQREAAFRYMKNKFGTRGPDED